MRATPASRSLRLSPAISGPATLVNSILPGIWASASERVTWSPVPPGWPPAEIQFQRTSPELAGSFKLAANPRVARRGPRAGRAWRPDQQGRVRLRFPAAGARPGAHRALPLPVETMHHIEIASEFGGSCWHRAAVHSAPPTGIRMLRETAAIGLPAARCERLGFIDGLRGPPAPTSSWHRAPVASSP